MGLRDDDKEYLKQLAWIYPNDFIAEVGRLAEKVIAEDLARGERRHIRDIIREMFAGNQETGDGSAASPTLTAAEQAAAREWEETIRDWLLAGKIAYVAGLGPEVIVPLVALQNSTEENVATLAVAALSELSDGGAINKLCQEWNVNRNRQLAEIIAAQGYLATQPLELRLLTLLKTGAPQEQITLKTATVELLVEFLADGDPDVAKRAAELLTVLPSGLMTDPLCDLALAQPASPAERLVLAAGYAPTGESRAALFYCLTGQWDKYRDLEGGGDCPLLRRSYTAATEEERLRLLAVLRQQGDYRLLARLLLAGDTDFYLQLTASDWSAMVDALQAAQDWPEAYSLMLKAPINQSARLWTALNAAEWAPPKSGQDMWSRLRVAASPLTEELFPPDGRELGCLRGTMPQDRFRCLLFHPLHQILTAGTEDGRVFFWRLGTEWPWRVVDMHHDAVTAMAFSPDGQQLVTAGREGRVHRWKFPEMDWQDRVPGHGFQTELLTVNNSGRIQAASRGAATPLRIWEWSEGSLVNRGLFSSGLFPCLALHPQLKYLISGGITGMIGLSSVNGKILNRWPAHRGAIQHLAVSGSGQILASIGVDGEMIGWLLPEGRLLWRLKIGECHTFALNFQGDLAALADSDGRVRLFQTFWSKPLAGASHADWRHLAGQLIREPALVADGRNFILELLQGKFQYDFTL